MEVKPSTAYLEGAGETAVFVTLQDRKGMEFFRAEIPGRKFKK
jgi:hypothetical protein